jgi:hypothetical protein
MISVKEAMPTTTPYFYGFDKKITKFLHFLKKGVAGFVGGP